MDTGLSKLTLLTHKTKSSFAQTREKGWLQVYTVMCCYKTSCHWVFLRYQVTSANICRACQMRKGYDNPGRVSFQLGLYFLCHAPDPYGSEHLFHRERPVASQHSLRNCVDHLAALPTQAIRFDVNVTCYAPLSASQGAKTR